MSAPLRIAVLGAGRIGALHAGLLAREVPGAVLAAVADVDHAAAVAVAGPLGVEAAGDAEGLLRRDDVDAVAVCTSTPTHAELVVAAARAGKAVFCEKPVSLDLAEVDRALAAVRDAAVPLQVGFNRRFDPAHQAVRDAVAAGAIGEPHLLRISSRDPEPPPLAYLRGSGGIFLDMTAHDFDMARFVTGSEVREVFARGAVRVAPAFEEAGDLDTAVVTLEHESGCLTLIDNSRRAVYGYDQRVEAFGSGGLAASDNPLQHTAVLRDASGTRGAALPHFFLERYAASFTRAWRAFVDAVGRDVPPPVTGADGRAPLVIGLAALRSVREGRSVHVAEVDG